MEQAREASKKLNVLHESSDIPARHARPAKPENVPANSQDRA
jgi:hypothetical protein